ncbi:unnamed protein product [Camellia sinensis]
MNNNPIYKNPNSPIESRIKDLLSRMTLSEKIGQITQIDQPVHILSTGGGGPFEKATSSDWIYMIDRFQNATLESRLGIPLLYGTDAVHGNNNVYGATVFPHNIGLGATRDAELVRRIGVATALEVRARGAQFTFAPCVADPTERANMILEHVERMDYKRYVTPKDIVEGSANLNLAFVAQIFQQRNGLSMDTKNMSFAEMMIDDAQTSREERCFRLWINSLGVDSYVNNMFEDVRTGWVILEVLDKVYLGSVNWKQATKPPIKMPFRKVENCNQAIRIGKELNFSLVNVAGNDIEENLSAMNTDPWYSAYHYSHPPLLKDLLQSMNLTRRKTENEHRLPKASECTF